MSATIPADFKPLFENPNFATITTVFEDGQPQASVVWVKLEDDKIKFSVTTGRQKYKNMEDNPKVSVLIIDPDNGYRYIEVRGEVSMTENGGVDLINELAKKYTGNDEYYGGVAPAERKDKEQRVVVTLTPDHVVTNG